jgi:hypothetical protein
LQIEKGTIEAENKKDTKILASPLLKTPKELALDMLG